MSLCVRARTRFPTLGEVEQIKMFQLQIIDNLMPAANQS
jgi:hypothetical protein